MEGGASANKLHVADLRGNPAHLELSERSLDR